jgi:hypothetical protein
VVFHPVTEIPVTFWSQVTTDEASEIFVIKVIPCHFATRTATLRMSAHAARNVSRDSVRSPCRGS